MHAVACEVAEVEALWRADPPVEAEHEASSLWSGLVKSVMVRAEM